jgi:uncharacterized protein YodC (DUF2158 family)
MIVVIMFVVAGMVLYRWYNPRGSKRNHYSQTEITPIQHRAVQTDMMDEDSSSICLSDIDIDYTFFAQ